MRLSPAYVIRRVLMFLLTVWIAASVNFIVPRLAPGDPIGAMISQMSYQGATVQNSAQIIAEYRKMFGLDQPLWVQYLKYLVNVVQFHLGYSLTAFPATVTGVIGRALPWTIGLLGTATLLSFIFGTLLGALMGWTGSTRLAKAIAPLFMILAAVPYYLFAILLLAILAFGLHWFPSSGTNPIGAVNQGFLTDAVQIVDHSILPALSIVLTAIGGWALGIRALMVSVSEQDFLTLAEAKGLSGVRIFFRYALRNAVLPQITGFAIALGSIASGGVLVETIFSYPRIGYQLYQAIGTSDYTVIEGITFILVVAVAFATLIVDLLNPFLDPRIKY